MKEARYPMVAGEGIPVLMLAIAAAALCAYFVGWITAVPLALASAVLFLLFRDPHRQVPSHPLAAVSPVDGYVVEVTTTAEGINGAAAHRIILRVDAFGAYTARSPVEGTILDPKAKRPGPEAAGEHAGLWIRTDEGDDVLLRFHGYRLGLAPRAFSRYGERVGQGERCAYLRLTRYAEVWLPVHSRVQVVKGQRLRAGSDILGTLPHP
ncbi:MAG: hypothetical protein L0Y45_08775 [Woeseiaceae bacterium]|nr:hypothetical protein [Woeseiaceae bacterium]